MFGLSKVAVRIVAALALIVLILLALQLRSCALERTRAAQSRVDQGQSGAFHNSAGDAVNTISGVAANQSAGADTSRRNEEEIRNAKGADTRVDPDANAAGLRALCRRASHRNDPACRVLEPNP